MHDHDAIFFSESNTSYYGAQNDHFRLLSRLRTSSSWIALVDDDTFVNVDNLRRMLRSLRRHARTLVGHVLDAYECLWGGAGMILSREAYVSIKRGMDSRQVVPLTGRQRNDVEIVKWARRLNISIVHSNLLWGDAVPESSIFFKEMHSRRHRIQSSIRSVSTMHKMCEVRSCKLMYDTYDTIKNTVSSIYTVA